MRLTIPLALAALAACATNPPPSACAVGAPAMTAELFFGRLLHDGGTVSDADWRDFLAREVTPRFPDGLTVLDGHGQWRQRDTDRVVGEPSSVVVIVTQPGAATLQRLDAIRAAYRAQFAQDSVGLVTEPGCASF